MEPVITSRQNQMIKQTSKLLRKKERDIQHSFLIQGWHMLEEAKKANCLKKVFLLEGLTFDTDVQLHYCTQEVLNKLSSQNSDAQIIGVCDYPTITNQSKRILAMDCIQDPGNMGTLIRTAHSFGFNQILCSWDCVDIYNPKVIQSTQGAIFHVQINSCDLKEELSLLKERGMVCYATNLDSSSISLSQVQPTKPYVVVVGNEGNGIRKEVIDCCDTSIIIEMEDFESLNVGVAGGIAMYTLKQREKRM